MAEPKKAAKDVHFCPFCGGKQVAVASRSDAIAECKTCNVEFEIMKLS